MLKLFLASLLVGSGILLGAVLAIIAKEELKPGMKYFLLIKNIIYPAIILIASFYYFDINFIISVLLLIFIPIIFIKKFQLSLIYISFAIIYMLSGINSSLFLLISSLIFFAGFPIASIAVSDLKKNKLFNKKILAPYILFIFIVASKYIIQFFL